MKQSFFEETGCDILGLFINRVHNTPDDVVIFSNDISITYKEAWRMVNHYAAEIEKKTCNKHTRVLLYLNHSYKIIISILAVLKTGNSYVPVSKSNGTERLFQISRYCNSDIVITDEKLVTEKKLIQFDDLVHYVDTDDFTYHRYSSGEEVYVLFTSGSTGEPKGCSLVYSNLVYILRNMITIGSCQSDSVYCFSTPYTFDVSTTEIFGFVYGASIYVCDISGYTSFRRFPADIQKYHITHIALSPSGLRNMLQAYSQEQWAQINSTVECIMVAGEVFDKEIFSQWDEAKWRFRLLNLYGPTEATVYATQYELHHGEVFEGSIPIGQPLQGCGYLIDKCGRDGVGELVLYGDGIANGYINNVTEEKKRFFVSNGLRHYRTGDLVSKNREVLYFHGRNDSQVQINGIRVELGEIESRIRELPDVIQAVVFYEKKRLIAFIQLKTGVYVTSQKIKKDLETRMPRYMIPNSIRFVDSFKLNNSNKIDRKELLKSYIESVEYSTQKGKNDLESNILRMMLKCIHDDSVKLGVDDDFYECGGDSLGTIYLLSQIETEYNIVLSADSIYLLKSAKNIANYLRKKSISNPDNTVDQGTGKLLINIPELTTQIKEYLYNSQIIKHTYSALPIHQSYYFNKFPNIVPFIYDIEESASYVDIHRALTVLLQENSILYSKLQLRDQRLLFEEYQVESTIIFPEIECSMTEDIVKRFIIDNYSNEIFWARYHGGFLATFIIVRFQSKTSVIGLLDHTIADLQTVTLIKIKLSNILLGKSNERKNKFDYRFFCDMIKTKNTGITNVKLRNYLEFLNTCNYNSILEKTPRINCIPTHIVVKDFQSHNSLYTSQYVAFLIGEQLAKYIDCNNFALGTIVNLREYRNYSFRDVLGDFHATVPFVYRRHMSFNEFCLLGNRILELFSNEYLDLKSNDELYAVWQKCKMASIDYLGALDDAEFESFVKNINQVQWNLIKNQNIVIATAVHNRKDLHIFVCADVIRSLSQG